MAEHLSEEQLDRVVDGEMQSEERVHLKGCASCRSLAAERLRQERVLREMLYRVHCPRPLVLFDHVTGVRHSETIQEHLSGCDFCGAEVASLARWDALPLTTPPIAPSPSELFRKLIGRVLPSPTVQPALRGDGNPVTIYEAGEVLLTLERLPSMRQPDRCALHGSVLVQDGDLSRFEEAIARLSYQGDIVAESLLTPFGSFSFESIPPDLYRLTLTMPPLYIVIDELRIE